MTFCLDYIYVQYTILNYVVNCPSCQPDPHAVREVGLGITNGATVASVFVA